ncbi:MAG: DUF5020 family protein [Candidatus Azobacteroides sp.]|nr:DUF5020 family protein [Candidatus Azobacteroides sp.]
MISVCVPAQNLQLHYDFRHALYDDVPPPNFFTATFEMFKPDQWGSTFMFVDLNFDQSRGNIGLAYMEIARDFKIKNFQIMPHIEYNGGVGNNNNSGFSVANAYLAGASYSFVIPNAQFNTYITYKYNAFQKVSNDVQWTVSWGAGFWKNRIAFCGFMDIWTENKDYTGVESGKKVILLTEPQIWYNVTQNLSFGSEIEISNNFYPQYGTKIYAFPTLAGKWTF